MRRFVILLLFAACAPSYEDVVGPYTGEARRYVVDRIFAPTTSAQVRQYAGDLNGDGIGDNGLGGAIAFLASQDDVTSYGDDMLDAGVIASSVIVTADDYTNDDSVSVRYLASDDDATGIEVGGRFIDGVFEPNRTWWTKVPGAATVRLPVFADADPSTIHLEGLEIEVEPDPEGGLMAMVHGVVVEDIYAAAYPGIVQMLDAHPCAHRSLWGQLDNTPRDGEVSIEELEGSSIIASFLSPDLLYRGKTGVSLGFEVHLSECAEGPCRTARTSCFDRVLDGDELHVDCGGSCGGCGEGASCTAPEDCESNTCSNGTCTRVVCE